MLGPSLSLRMLNQAFELAWRRRGVALPVVCGFREHRCHHVEQELGVVHQAAGDDGVEMDVDLEASHNDLQEKELVPALLAGIDGVLPGDEHVDPVQKGRAYYDTID